MDTQWVNANTQELEMEMAAAVIDLTTRLSQDRGKELRGEAEVPVFLTCPCLCMRPEQQPRRKHESTIEVG